MTRLQGVGVLVLLAASLGLQVLGLRGAGDAVAVPAAGADGAQVMLGEILAELRRLNAPGHAPNQVAAPRSSAPVSEAAARQSAAAPPRRVLVPAPTDPGLQQVLERIETLLQRQTPGYRAILPHGSEAARLRRPLDRQAVMAFAAACEKDSATLAELRLRSVDEAIRRFGLPTRIGLGKTLVNWDFDVDNGGKTIARVRLNVVGGVIINGYGRVY